MCSGGREGEHTHRRPAWPTPPPSRQTHGGPRLVRPTQRLTSSLRRHVCELATQTYILYILRAHAYTARRTPGCMPCTPPPLSWMAACVERASRVLAAAPLRRSRRRTLPAPPEVAAQERSVQLPTSALSLQIVCTHGATLLSCFPRTLNSSWQHPRPSSSCHPCGWRGLGATLRGSCGAPGS